MAVEGVAAVKRRPYEHLSDQELWSLAGEAAELRIRLAEASPGEVLQTLLEHGCPKKAALRQVQDPLLRGHAARFHVDVADARLGDGEARARVEHVTGGWAKLRAAGRPE
jgi:hypothetical protein